MPTQQPYGDNFQQGGQYPSPYQARYRLHSKHGNRSYKRRANASAGGDGSSAFGGGGSGAGLGLASAASHQRGRTERDRFLVDINSGGQRSGVSAASLLQARKNVRLIDRNTGNRYLQKYNTCNYAYPVIFGAAVQYHRRHKFIPRI